MKLKWQFFTETGKVRSGKNPKSRFFLLEVHLETCFESKTFLSNPDFGFLTLPTLPVSVKYGHLSKELQFSRGNTLPREKFIMSNKLWGVGLNRNKLKSIVGIQGN